jgi:hypothetical protein
MSRARASAHMRWHRLVLAAGLLVPVVTLHCGARTGLPIPEVEDEEPPVEPTSCLVFEARGQLAPLDVFIMMDSSGSMIEDAGVTSKWSAVSSALSQFFNDAGSAGLGVSLSYFPRINSFIPAECYADPTVCGEPDACTTTSFCELSGLACAAAVDCDLQGAVGEACVPLGFCQGSQDVICSAGTALDCPFNIGPCIEYGYCANRTECEVEAYAIPDVSIDELPDAAPALAESLLQKYPNGFTPTKPALAGALEQAVLSVEERKRKAIVVLATDGFPTACEEALEQSLFDPAIIGNVAAVAEAGVEDGVQTFVIGVFNDAEADFAQENLDEIAVAGGTATAFIVTTTSLTQDFAAALTEVRVAATACEYSFAAEHASTDWTRAHVFVTPDVQTPPMELLQLGSATECTGESLAFYVAEGIDGLPRLVLCPSTCSFLGNVEIHPLEIRVGCGLD